jgi:hypothetical protein
LAWVNKDVGIKSDLFGVDFLFLQGIKLAKYSPNIQGNFVYYFSYYFREYLSTKEKVS